MQQTDEIADVDIETQSLEEPTFQTSRRATSVPIVTGVLLGLMTVAFPVLGFLTAREIDSPQTSSEVLGAQTTVVQTTQESSSKVVSIPLINADIDFGIFYDNPQLLYGVGGVFLFAAVIIAVALAKNFMQNRQVEEGVHV